MARILITGSSDGLGLMVGRLLAREGPGLTLPARDGARADATHRALPEAQGVEVDEGSPSAGCTPWRSKLNAVAFRMPAPVVPGRTRPREFSLARKPAGQR